MRGLAMPNLGDIDAQSLAGALATGTHGTGTRLPNLSGQVERVELVLADGSALTIDGGDELLAARRLARGARGDRRGHAALCARVPASSHRRARTAATAARAAAQRADAHDHFEFWAFPHADTALTRTLDRTDDPPAAPVAPAPT